MQSNWYVQKQIMLLSISLIKDKFTFILKLIIHKVGQAERKLSIIIIRYTFL